MSHMIRKQLAAEGVETAKGKDTWSKLAIEKMLTNEKYMGDVRIAKPQGKRKGRIDVTVMNSHEMESPYSISHASGLS